MRSRTLASLTLLERVQVAIYSSPLISVYWPPSYPYSYPSYPFTGQSGLDDGKDWPLGKSILFGRESVMTDELKNGNGIGYVHHIVRDLAIPEPVLYTDPTEVRFYVAHRGVYPNDPYLFCNASSRGHMGYRPFRLAWQSAFATLGQNWDVRLAATSSLLPEIELDARRVIPKIMQKLDRFNGLTYILEARELPSMIRWARAHAALIGLFKNQIEGKRLRKLIRDEIRKSYGKHRYTDLSINEQADFVSRFALKQMRDTYLGVLFGLMPTVGETMSMMTEYRDQLEKGPRKANQFSVGVFEEALETEQRSMPPVGIVDDSKVITLARARSVIGATVEIKLNPLVSMGTRDINKQIKEMLGHNPLAPLWAVAPGSFVVDWFWRVDNILDAVYLEKSRDFSIQWWKSHKTSREIDLRFRYIKDVVHAVGGPNQAFIDHEYVYAYGESTARFSSYKREPIATPNAIFKPVTPVLPSKGKLFTLALLALGLIDGSSPSAKSAHARSS